MVDSRLFSDDRIERLTRTHISVFCVVWTGVLIFLGILAFQGLYFIAGLFASLAGIFSWTLFEYIVHRYLFHIDLRSERMNTILFMTHGVHHHDPNDDTRNLMPLAVSLPIAAVLYWVGYVTALFAGLDQIGQAVMFGFFSGYVIYDLIHYACHQWPMRHPVLRAIKKHHMRHHFRDDASNFGVSSGLWDLAFGTLHRPGPVPAE
jgi:sterol desaturase/sphingolipid hydroxylase (fatty acid hydroxylase superfamily)